MLIVSDGDWRATLLTFINMVQDYKRSWQAVPCQSPLELKPFSISLVLSLMSLSVPMFHQIPFRVVINRPILGALEGVSPATENVVISGVQKRG